MYRRKKPVSHYAKQIFEYGTISWWVKSSDEEDEKIKERKKKEDDLIDEWKHLFGKLYYVSVIGFRIHLCVRECEDELCLG